MAGSDYVGAWDDALPKSVGLPCGWCGIAVEMPRISASIEIRRENAPARQAVDILAAATYVCPRDQCHRPSLVIFNFYAQFAGDTSDLTAILQFPRGHAPPMEGLPDAIESVRREAWSSYYGGDYRAAVVMGRAAVQRGVRTLLSEDEQPAKVRTLYDEIASLRDEGLVTEHLKKWAHTLRIAGAEAAHPEELGDVTDAEAKESLKWADEFLKFTIALPALHPDKSPPNP
jgi:hypothetical protein